MSVETQAEVYKKIDTMQDSFKSRITPIFDALRKVPGQYNEKNNNYWHVINQNRFPGGWDRNFYTYNRPAFKSLNIGTLEDRRTGEWQVIWYEPKTKSTTTTKPVEPAKATGTEKAIKEEIKAKAVFTVKDRENTFTMRTDPAYYEADLYNVLAKHSEIEYTTGTTKKKKLKAVFIGKRIGKRKKSAKVDERDKTLVADIGMLYYFADHAATKGYDVKIIDGRGQFTKKPIDVEVEANKLRAKEGGKPFKFREYQREAIQAALQRKNGILRLATGAGKTEIAIGLIGEIGGDALFVVPRKSLAVQTYNRLKHAGFKNVGILYGEVKDISNTPGELDVNVVVKDSGYNLLHEKRSLLDIPSWELTAAQQKKVNALMGNPAEMKKYKESIEKARARGGAARKAFFDFVKQADTVVFDEAHHVKAETYAAFALANPASFRYGLSATPFSDDELQTAQVREKLGDILYDLPASSLIAYKDGNRYLSTPIFKMIPFAHDKDIETIIKAMKEDTYIYQGGEDGKESKWYGVVVNSWTGRAIDRSITRSFHNQRYQSFLKHFINQNEQRNKLIAMVAVEFAKRKMPAIIVVESIDHGVRIKMSLDEAGVRSEMVASTEDPGEDEGEEEEGANEAARIKIVTATADREAVFKKMATGELDVMIGTSGLIGEGLDIPDLMAAIIAQGGKSFTRAYQRAGRVMRLHTNESGFRGSHSLIIELYDCLTDKRIERGVTDSSQIVDVKGKDELIPKAIRPIKYFGEHFERRIQLYMAEKEFVLSWARSIKEVFSVDFMNADGTTVTKDPWLKANASRKRGKPNATGKHETAARDRPAVKGKGSSKPRKPTAAKKPTKPIKTSKKK